VSACIRGCIADHSVQPPGLQECAARDSVGTIRDPIGRSATYVSAGRWQDPAGTGGEVVLYRYVAGCDDDPDPLTYTPGQARDLATLLNHAAELVEPDLGGGAR
jgi:hypothetical protein